MAQCDLSDPLGVRDPDIFEYMLEKPDLKEYVLERYKDLSSEDYDACVWCIWLLLSSRQMFTQLLKVEVEPGDIDVNRWVEKMTEKIEYHFKHKEQRNEADDQL